MLRVLSMSARLLTLLVVVLGFGLLAWVLGIGDWLGGEFWASLHGLFALGLIAVMLLIAAVAGLRQGAAFSARPLIAALVAVIAALLGWSLYLGRIEGTALIFLHLLVGLTAIGLLEMGIARLRK